jgi:hypothetical protein
MDRICHHRFVLEPFVACVTYQASSLLLDLTPYDIKIFYIEHNKLIPFQIK